MAGNKCGHCPDQPRWFTAPENHTRPKIITKAIDEIQRYYKSPASIIPSLNLANGSERQQRSERREACLDVMGCLLHYLDLTTLRVGIPQHDLSFQGITMPFIAQKSGLCLRRTERAVADLVKAGLITVHPLCEKISDTVYKGYAAIRTVSHKLFTLFGMGGRLKYERDRATARQKKKDRKQESKNKAKVDLVIGTILGGAPANSTDKSTRANELRSIKAILNSS